MDSADERVGREVGGACGKGAWGRGKAEELLGGLSLIDMPNDCMTFG